MATWLIIVLGVLGFLALAAGVLIWLFFHQGGCCIRRAKEKLTRKSLAAPVLR
jgi:hypothetical protein